MTEPFSQANLGGLCTTCKSSVATDDPDRMLTTKEVADLLRLPVDTLYAWRITGDGPKAHKVGKHLRFDREDLRAFIASKKER